MISLEKIDVSILWKVTPNSQRRHFFLFKRGFHRLEYPLTPPWFVARVADQTGLMLALARLAGLLLAV